MNLDSVLVEAIQSLAVSDSASAANDTNDTNNEEAPSSATATADNATAATATAATTETTLLQPIYIPTASGNDTWELTWPIWHMLPIDERKDVAKQNGFKSIGDFEESVILSRVLNAGSDGENNGKTNANANGDEGQQQRLQQEQYVPQPYSSEQMYEMENRPNNFGLPILAERTDIIHRPTNNGKHINDGEHDKHNDNDSSSSDDDDDEYYLQQRTTKAMKTITTNGNDAQEEEEKDIENGGLILLLPNELIIHFILPFLPMDYYAKCATISPHWKHFTRTEAVYKELCKRCYLHQSKRKTLHIHRFDNSYHNMLNKRYRVKTGCGFYVLKCSKIKQIQRDMWTEIPFGVILESIYYRYIYFFEDGTLLYALTSKAPHEMVPIFLKMREENSHKHESISAVLGSYEIQKDVVTVNVVHPWHHVRLVLRVLRDGYSGSNGRFWALEFEKHWSSKRGDFDEYWSRDLIEYKVPANDPVFRFMRDWRL